MIDEEQKLTVPLLDRLLDDHPEQQQESARAHHLLIYQLKESVRRDLENLFNTRQCCVGANKSLSHVQNALPNYGLPDAATLNLSSQKARLEFCRTVEAAIKRFEPRIRIASVKIQSAFDAEDPSIRFRVEASLHALSADEVIVFDSALNPLTQSVKVAESN